MAPIGASAVQQTAKGFYAALPHAASFRCLVEEWQDCEELDLKWLEKGVSGQTSGSQEALHSGVRLCKHCVRCGRSSKKIKMPGTGERPRWLGKTPTKKLKRLGKAHLGGHDMVRRVDPNGEALLWCRKCSGYAKCRLGPKLSEPLLA